MNSLLRAGSLALFTLSLTALAEPAATTPPAQTADTAVGLSSHDGINMSGTDVLITRNGISQKLTKEMGFPSGAKVMPDGTLVGTDGSKTMLRTGQIVTLDGKMMNAPVVEAVPAGATSIAPAQAQGQAPAPAPAK